MLEVSNQVQSWYQRKRLLVLMKKVQKYCGKRNVSVSLAFVTPGEMKRVNTLYRKKDSATNVLSFLIEKNRKGLVGEVIICPSVVRKQAKQQGILYSQHMERLFVHGLLHVCGVHHTSKNLEKRMEKIEEKILGRSL
ncbi:MAG: rRNA maturation RNase YbeY [Candidatus Jacksonbacteria bacterium]|mgnify:FL=1|jgi:probable rRNA maturation factor|nr:rRNA maturation RNase YbeY [Candidatus Jacksonbacteria bacterium]MBT6034753.1 rRNA maturation RNase YbeY [Candidatus Jacksonbacteria bacterium]MBT6301191.1 rRNA maturation RNase YbeY [Candidatus Jacksonbacteria bacterium]MBT6757062.1 rRNA maturation RNase YbeY [Candidatus Jacksonbacteria bacterium]MBT6954794.1 rRNA maturation RNase YbeY [Candidatus Jacksonbacteria bacterium]